MTPSHSVRSSNPRVMFLTRRYPPSVGGMETLARDVHLALEEHGPTTLVALGRSQRNLVWFLPYAALRAFWAALRGKVDRFVFGDALVYSVVRPFLPRSAPPCTVMVHGLDLTFQARPYQALVRAALPKADRVVANSRSTMAIAEAMGLDSSRCGVLNPGVAIPPDRPGTRDDAADEIRQRFGLPADALLLATLGRLVKRKGVQWFVEEVMPLLPERAVLLAAGAGAEETAISDAIQQRGLESRVFLLGSVDKATRGLLFAGSDVFVMPNVPVEGDVEGFGLVAIEASNSGALVVASKLEGIVDAVVDETTGYLCEPLDVDGWLARLTALLDDPDATRVAAERFSAESRRRSSYERMAREIPVALGIIEPDDAGSGAASQEQQSP